MRTLGLVICTFAVVGAGFSVRAYATCPSGKVTVVVTNRLGGGCNGMAEETCEDPGVAFDVPIAPCAQYVNIYTTPNLLDVGRVTITGTTSGTFPLFVDIGSLWSGGSFESPTASEDFGGLHILESDFKDRVHFEGHIGGDLTGDIQVGHVYRVDIDGTMSGTISASAGDINQIFVDGDMLGDLDAFEDMDQINVGGRIGTPGDLISITAGVTSSDRREITSIIASSCHADITIGRDVPDFGQIRVFQITGGGGYDGDFEGSLTVERVIGGENNFVSIAGDLLGDLHIFGNISRPVHIFGDVAATASIKTRKIRGITPPNIDGSITVDGDMHGRIDVVRDDFSDGLIQGDITVQGQMTGAINIGKSIEDTATISMPNGGLLGQITINTEDFETPLWDGTISVGTVELDPSSSQPDQAPYYERSSAELGGGSVGLARFDFHPQDSYPTVGQIIPPKTTLTEIRLSYYGPVLASGAGIPVMIERLAIPLPECEDPCNMPCTEIDWVDVTADFAVEVQPQGAAREVLITPISGSIPGPYFYRVIPYNGSEQLTCENIVGQPPVTDHGHNPDEHPTCEQNYIFYKNGIQSI